MKKLLVTGASGLLGLNLALKAADLGWDVTGWSGRRALARVPFSAEQVDLANPEDIPARISMFALTWSSTAPRWRILTRLNSTRRWRKG